MAAINYDFEVLDENGCSLAFHEMTQDRNIGVVFHNVLPEERTVFWWLDYLKATGARVIRISQHGKTACYLWLERGLGNVALSHFWISPDFRRKVMEFGPQGLWFAFNYLQISAMIGLIRKENRGAYRAAKQLGYKLVDILPEALYDAKRGRHVACRCLVLKKDELPN